MTLPNSHPSDALLMAYAAGSLDEGQSLVVATHLQLCPSCRHRLQLMEAVGGVLLEDFLKPMGLSQNELARALRVPPRRINEIVLGKRSISADTDLRLARYFSVSEGLFLGL